MKERLSKNFGLKLLALCASILLWIVVISMENPVTRRTFTGIPVTVAHPEIITNSGNTYRVSDNSRVVSVTVRGKQSVINKIKAEDIRAVADFRNLTSTRQIEIEASVPAYASDIMDATAYPRTISVEIDAEKTKTFPITVLTSGTLRDGYVIDSLESDPGRVEISGPEKVITSIAKVVAEVDVTGLSRNAELDAELVLYDGAGKIIDSTQVATNLGEEGVTVKVKLLHTKSLPVQFDTSGIHPARGYKFSGITVQPEKVDIVGTEVELSTIKMIEIPAEALMENNLTKSVERTIDISEYLPSWARPVDEKAGIPVVVSIVIEKYGTRSIQISAGSISLINIPKGYTATCEATGNLEVVITGADDDMLSQVELGQGDVAVNLVTYKEAGIYEVPVQVKLPTGVELMHELTVTVKLEEENSGGEDG